jgi:pimeloyl-ACP methyl ester carboxylesterase
MGRRAGVAEQGPTEARVRRAYFECRYGQLHLHHAMPAGGGFDEATPVLCAHDGATTGRAFARLLTRLGRTRSVYAPDLPGHGESDAPPAASGAAELAAALGDFLADLRLRSVDLVGAGTGSHVALELALARPAEVRRLVLLGIPEGSVHQHLRERLPLIAQPTLVVRARDAWWDTTGRLRELIRGARALDYAERGPDLLDAGADALASELAVFFTA